jgi:hypothetical protein
MLPHFSNLRAAKASKVRSRKLDELSGVVLFEQTHRAGTWHFWI